MHGGALAQAYRPRVTCGKAGDYLAGGPMSGQPLHETAPGTHGLSTGSRRTPNPSADDPGEVLDLPERRVSGLHLSFDLLDGVKGGRVIAPSE